jgi:hypothetical protein
LGVDGCTWRSYRKLDRSVRLRSTTSFKPIHELSNRTTRRINIQTNRDPHRELFLKAQEGYRKLVIEELDRMLADAKAGRQISRSINLAKPVDHTADYDGILAMLKMSVHHQPKLCRRRTGSQITKTMGR